MEFGNFAPIDPIASLKPGVPSMYQCLTDNCSNSQLESQVENEMVLDFKNKCQTALGGQFRECCPENLKQSFNQQPVYVKELANGQYSSCFHELNQTTQQQIQALMSDPAYNYKDLAVDYTERVRRYRALLTELCKIWANSEFGRTCQGTKSISECLQKMCPARGYRLATNDYETCMSSGDLLVPRTRGTCQSVCKQPSSGTQDSASPGSRPSSGTDRPTVPPQSRTTQSDELTILKRQVNYLLAKEHSGQEQAALERPDMLVNSLVPPDRRSNITEYHDSLNLPLNPPGRGDYGGFSIVGYLQLVNHPERRLPLYGRRVTPQTYQYYTISHIDPQLRVPVRGPDDRALNTNQIVIVPGYDRPFQVVMYGPDYHSFRPY